MVSNNKAEHRPPISLFLDRESGVFRIERGQGDCTEVIAEQQVDLDKEPSELLVGFVRTISEAVLAGKVTEKEGVRLTERCEHSFADKPNKEQF